MKLTTKSEYSILALIYIAKNQKKGPVKTDKICQQYDIPKKYLEFLLSILKQNQIIKSKRGASGGHILAVAPNKISIAQVVRMLDGAIAPTESVSKYFYSITPLSNEKKALAVFKDIRNYIADKLENTKISDLI